MKPKSFEHLKTTLDGCKLIESSAGTGKTYAIASLYVRLLLEKALQVHQILVVTFTEAATAELKSRIRDKIRTALRAFESGTAVSGDDFLRELVASLADKDYAQAALRQALYSFDEAAIFTIHGFCQKALQENAFESASPFNTELIADQSLVCREIIDDFWRNHLYKASPLLAQHAMAASLKEDLLQLFGNTLSNPMLKVIPGELRLDPLELESLETKARTSHACAAQVWSACSDEVKRLMLAHDGLHKSQYKKNTIQKWFDELDFYLASSLPLPRPDWLIKFSPSTLKKYTNRGFQTPEHPFFNACEELRQDLGSLTTALNRHLLALRVESLRFAGAELRRRKQRRNVRSFEDLLLDLSAALKKPAGRILAASLRNRFKAALIDEFQDTDPIQYEIFNSIFADGSSLFLIGDPKQAIYGFRGADIFAYMKAAEDVEDQYTLSRNWRSAPGIIKAVNTLFQQQRTPFVFPEIRYFKAEPAPPQVEAKFTVSGKPEASPLKIWFLRRQAGSAKLMSKTEAAETIPEAVASEIVQLLNAGKRKEALIEEPRESRIEKRGVSPWDIAVLVRTNRQAHEMQRALRRHRVPSVVYGTGSVFETNEAMELERVLSAIADPGNEGGLKAALATDLMGIGGDELARLAGSDTAWDTRLRDFANYRNLWTEKGFITMIRTWLAKEEVRKRLLAFADGERRLTNLLHCIELLQDTALREKFGIEGVLKWLAVQMEQAGGKADAQEIRLETDEKALKVITVHKSKGLEFPIVYCPYVWDARDTPTNQATFHDEKDRTILIRDLGSDQLDSNRALEQKEALAEQCRLFYVALTRAKYRCTVCWGAINDAGRSAPAYLFHLPANASAHNLAAEIKAHFENLTDEQILGQLGHLARESGNALQVMDIPEPIDDTYQPFETAQLPYRVRQFSEEIPADWGNSSFSRLTAGESRQNELPDHDATGPVVISSEAPELAARNGRSILEFPKGTRAGTFLHKIFEELDFANTDESSLNELVRKNLDLFGFDEMWGDAVCAMVRNVLSTPLARVGEQILLSGLSRTHCLSEMEFGFPLDRITPERLADIFERHKSVAIPRSFPDLLSRLDFRPLRGLMKGFIDLVFQRGGRYYLLDWKSNYLGPQIEDYDQASMQRAMERNFYILQYHLYAVALDRYLKFRIGGYKYENQFGGIFYLFLRGIDPARGPMFGVYADRPPETLIAELSAQFSKGSHRSQQ
jgi:exodeoxyribonuclease V beta subunit